MDTPHDTQRSGFLANPLATHPALSGYQRASFQSSWVADYLLRAPEKPTRLIVLLHGFAQRGEWIYRKLEPHLPADAVVIAPCAPFPLPRVPRVEGEKLELGYSWYFYDARVDEYLIDMRVGVDFVFHLLEYVVQHLGLDQLPTDLIGFSQGGYLAPHLATRLPNCQRVIGIACEFLVDEMEFPVHFRMDQIQGEADEVTMPMKAKLAHDRLRERGVVGEFHGVPGLGHRIDGRVQELVRGMY
jgi:predicted esterase